MAQKSSENPNIPVSSGRLIVTPGPELGRVLTNAMEGVRGEFFDMLSAELTVPKGISIKNQEEDFLNSLPEPLRAPGGRIHVDSITPRYHEISSQQFKEHNDGISHRLSRLALMFHLADPVGEQLAQRAIDANNPDASSVELSITRERLPKDLDSIRAMMGRMSVINRAMKMEKSPNRFFVRNSSRVILSKAARRTAVADTPAI